MKLIKSITVATLLTASFVSFLPQSAKASDNGGISFLDSKDSSITIQNFDNTLVMSGLFQNRSKTSTFSTQPNNAGNFAITLYIQQNTDNSTGSPVMKYEVLNSKNAVVKTFYVNGTFVNAVNATERTFNVPAGTYTLKATNLGDFNVSGRVSVEWNLINL